jgi:predicted transcriptional regulator of viral defense system
MTLISLKLPQRPAAPQHRWPLISSTLPTSDEVRRTWSNVSFFLQKFAFDEKTEHTMRMLSSTHTQRVLDLASQKGLLRASDLEAIDAPRVVLTRLTTAGLLEKVGRGLYRLPDAQVSEFESLGTIATKVPQAVFCLLTALQFHELTTQLPRQVWIAMPRGSHLPRVDYPPVKLVQFTGDAYTAGIEEVERDGVRLRVYSVAKTVADCFKHRNKIGLDVALEALKDARTRSKASVDDIWRFAKVCRVANVMRPYLESVG